MKRNYAIIALLLCTVCLMLCGCGNQNRPSYSAGYSTVSADDDKVIVVKVETDEGVIPELVIRRIEKPKDAEYYRVMEEFYPAITEPKHIFTLVVQEEGLYEVEASTPDGQTQLHIIEVDENVLYSLYISITTQPS